MANLNPVITTTGGFPNAIAIYYDRKLLERLEFDLFMNQFGEKRQLPKGKGNSVTFTRYNNFAASTTPLTEAQVPDGETLQSTQINAVPVQYGNYVTLSDQLITEAIDPVIQGALDVLGYQAALSLDTIIQTTLHGAMTSQFAGGAVSEATTSAVVNANEIRKAVKSLKTVAARPFPGGYVFVCHPATSYDLQSDSAVGGWLDINKYTVTGPTYNGEVGKLYGARVVESQNIQTGTGASSAVTYRNWMIAKQAYGVIDLAGHNLKMISKQLGSSGVSDPLDQLSTVGYKFSHVTKKLDAIRMIELIGTSAS
jgi:N4-gp56 family major capsid protein